jgi:hypothetical protein
MRKLTLDLSAVSVESFATAAPLVAGGEFAPTVPPYCNSYYTHCRCTPRADER